MKKIDNIDNIVLTLILISVVLIVYLNLDKIVKYTVNFFGDNKKIVLNEPNEYKRNYSVTHLKKYNTAEEYTPYTKDDVILIMYNVLNNGWTNFTFYCPKEYTDCKNDIEIVANDDKLLSDINNYVSPYNSYKKINAIVYTDGKVEIKVTKNYTDEEINKIKPEVKNVLTELNLTNLNTKQKITKIHDYYVLKTTYDKTRSETGSSNYTSNKAIGPMFENYGICSGLADTMAIYLDELNIPNIKVASEKHVWNLAYVDGKWLHIDLTWDLPLETTKDNIHTFLLTDTKSIKTLDSKEHTWDTSFYIEAN